MTVKDLLQRAVLLALAHILSLPLPVLARGPRNYWYDVSDDTKFWINAGLGGGKPDIASSICANWQSDKWPCYQVGFVHNSTFQLFGGTPKESATSIGALVGARTRPSAFTSAAFAGVGIVNGFHRGDEYLGGGGFLAGGEYSRNKYSVIGVIGNAQLFWKPAMTFGMGFQVNCCLNSELTFSSLQLSIQFGSDR